MSFRLFNVGDNLLLGKFNCNKELYGIIFKYMSLRDKYRVLLKLALSSKSI